MRREDDFPNISKEYLGPLETSRIAMNLNMIESERERQKNHIPTKFECILLCCSLIVGLGMLIFVIDLFAVTAVEMLVGYPFNAMSFIFTAVLVIGALASDIWGIRFIFQLIKSMMNK